MAIRQRIGGELEYSNRTDLLAELTILYSRMGDNETAEGLLSNTLKDGCPLDDADARNKVIQKVAETYAGINQMKMSLQAIALIDNQALRQEIVKSIAGARIVAGRIEESLIVASQLESPNARAAIIATIAASYRESNDEMSLRLIQELQRLLVSGGSCSAGRDTQTESRVWPSDLPCDD